MGTFLARYVMTQLVDDIDGSHAVTTLSFSLDGRSYEIDLSESHLSALQQALAPFVSAARALPNGRRPERVPAVKDPAVRVPAPKEAAVKDPAPKEPAPRRAPAPNGRAVAARDTGTDIVAVEATARPAAVESAVDSAPFRQPRPVAEPARSKPGRAPLVANPFKP
jgi:Lsr2 protein